MSDTQLHWERVYATKQPSGVSWYQPHLQQSLDLILQAGIGSEDRLIDVGGGASTLVDDLLAKGFRHIAVLDISPRALDVARTRLGGRAQGVDWIPGDVLTTRLPQGVYRLWHDRAVFHFLVDPGQRQAYVRSVLSAVRPGGHVIVSTFGPGGPTKCSGLDVMRYDAEALHREFGKRFRIEESSKELHHTPWGTAQQFVYCCCRVD